MHRPLRLISLHAIFLLSGLAGLGCQLTWTRMLSVGLGHEMPSVLAVVAAFFGGLALGAWLLGPRIERSDKPGLWYAGLEAVIGLWGLVTIPLIPLINTFAPRWIGIDPPAIWHWLLAFMLPLIVLLPATMAMGATLPAMQRFIAPLMRDGRSIGGLYAANTLGAVAGVWLGAFILGPMWGHTISIAAFAAVNLLCAITAALFARSQTAADQPPLPPGEGRGEGAAPNQPQIARSSKDSLPSDPPHPNPLPEGEGTGAITSEHSPVASRRHLALLLLFTGLLGIGFESLAVRAMSQVLENTIYSYAAALSVFLCGTAVGAAIYQRFGNRFAARPLLVSLLAAIALGCLIGVWQLDKAGSLHALRRQEAGVSLAAAFRAEMAVAASILLLPTLAMGANFSHLVEAARRTGLGVGRAVAINTLGGAIAPLLFVVVLVPVIGIVAALVIASLGYVGLLIPSLPRLKRVHLAAPLLPLAIIGLAMGTSLRPGQVEEEHIEQPANVAAGSKLLSYREGVMASVAVLESEAGRVLQVNNRFNMGSTAKAAVVIQRCQGHIPLLLHPNPKAALYLGTATGITLGAATEHRDLTITGVELLPDVVDAMKFFQPENGGPYDSARVALHIADARRFVRAAPQTFDVIVADLFHPAADGAGFLYTVEHFRAVRSRLAEGGLFCQWLPLYQLDRETLGVIIRSFLEVFPDARAFMADFNIDLPAIALVGGNGAMPTYSSTLYASRFTTAPQTLETIRAQELRLEDELRLLGRWIASSRTLAALAADALLNTDDRPRVLYDAPRSMHRNHAAATGTLLWLLTESAGDLHGLLDPSAPDAKPFEERLRRFIQARNRFTHGLVHARSYQTDQALIAYIDSARLSEDFTYGYAHAMSMALHVYRDNPGETRSILERLIEAQPARPAAKQFLDRLFPPN